MNRSEHINELAAALSKAQGQITAAIKESVNPHFRSKYADLGSVWAACRTPLTVNGLSVAQLPTAAEPGYAAMETVLMHASGQFISSVAQCRLTKDDAQGVGSAYTYLRRYGLAAVVGIVADEDDDGNAASQPERRDTYDQPRQPAAQQRQQPQTNGEGASEAQTRKIFAMKKELGWTDDEFKAWIGENNIDMKNLNKKQASWLIEEMTKAQAEAAGF